MTVIQLRLTSPETRSYHTVHTDTEALVRESSGVLIAQIHTTNELAHKT